MRQNEVELSAGVTLTLSVRYELLDDVIDARRFAAIVSHDVQVIADA